MHKPSPRSRALPQHKHTAGLSLLRESPAGTNGHGHPTRSYGKPRGEGSSGCHRVRARDAWQRLGRRFLALRDSCTSGNGPPQLPVRDQQASLPALVRGRWQGGGRGCVGGRALPRQQLPAPTAEVGPVSDERCVQRRRRERRCRGSLKTPRWSGQKCLLGGRWPKGTCKTFFGSTQPSGSVTSPGKPPSASRPTALPPAKSEPVGAGSGRAAESLPISESGRP